MMNMVKKFAAAISAVIMMAVGMAMNAPKASAKVEFDYNAMVAELSVLVNEAREEAGLEPLYLTPYLCEVANVRAAEITTNFSHTRPNGEKFRTAFNSIFALTVLRLSAVGENIAAGKATAAETFEQWKNSPSHWAAIMNPSYTHIGIGINYSENSFYGWYWSQFFLSAKGVELEGQQIVEREQLIETQKMAHQNQIVPQCIGDINGDGFVNSFDQIALIKYICGENELSELQINAGDVMEDGAINIADVIVMRRYILGIYNNLPVTPDML